MGNCDEELETVAGSVIRVLTTLGMLRAPTSAKPFSGTCSVGAATGIGVILMPNELACAGGCADELEATAGGETSTGVLFACVLTLVSTGMSSESSLPGALGIVS
jgi:hypothetical protein